MTRVFETCFYITSPASDAKTLHDYAQKHWATENDLHWMLDTNLRQDAIKRNGKAGNIALSVTTRTSS